MKRIVIVEDSPVVSGIYRNKLVADGFEVEVVTTGEAALESLSKKPADLVLLDIMLPQMSGLMVLQNLRNSKDTADLPVIVLSSTYVPEIMERAWAAGATQVLSKGTNKPKQVIEAVQAVLANSSLAIINTTE